MNISKIANVGESIGSLKILKNPKNFTTIEEGIAGVMLPPSRVQFPNGKIVDNMLDMFREATGTHVIDIVG